MAAASSDRSFDDLARSDLVTTLVRDRDGGRLLADGQVRELARYLSRELLPEGTVLFEQGDLAANAFVLVRGHVVGAASSPTGEVRRFVVEPGAVVGERSMLTGAPHSATVVAHTEVEVLRVSEDAFAHLLALDERVPEALSRAAPRRPVPAGTGPATPSDGRYARLRYFLTTMLRHDLVPAAFARLRTAPESGEQQRRDENLARSELVREFLVDEAGHPLLTDADIHNLAYRMDVV